MFESELFGHERGAFTGASKARDGLLARAANGTAFLDEIGDLTLTSQSKLLRVLEQRKIRSVGSDEWSEMSARVVCATNRDLDQARASGEFRDDLYYRLAGVTLRLPPLRARRADAPLLARHFLEEFNQENSSKKTMANSTVDCLFRHSWPGNVRELRNAIRSAARSSRTADGPISKARLLQTCLLRAPTRTAYTIPFDPASDSWENVQDRAWDVYLRALMEATQGNKAAAAKRAGISRSQFYERLKETRRRLSSASDEPAP